MEEGLSEAEANGAVEFEMAEEAKAIEAAANEAAMLVRVRATKTIEIDLDGQGSRRRRVHIVPQQPGNNRWADVTDIPCPVCHSGIVRWAENGYVPGYRICDQCHRHYISAGCVTDALHGVSALIFTGRRAAKKR